MFCNNKLGKIVGQLLDRSCGDSKEKGRKFFFRCEFRRLLIARVIIVKNKECNNLNNLRIRMSGIARQLSFTGSLCQEVSKS